MFANFYSSKIDIALIIVAILPWEVREFDCFRINSISEHNNHHEVRRSDSFHHSSHKSVREDPISEEPREIPSNLDRGALPDPHKALEIYVIKILIADLCTT